MEKTEQSVQRFQELENLGNYLELACKIRGEESKKICRSLGFGNDCIRSIVNGHEPSLLKIQKISNALNLPLETLMAAMNPINLGLAEGDTPELTRHRANAFSPEPSGYDYVAIEALPGARLGAARRDAECDAAPLWLPAELIQVQLHGGAGDFRWAEIAGTAMLPNLSPGDRVLIDTRNVRPIQPDMYAVDEGIGLTARWVELVPGSVPVHYRVGFADPHSMPTEIDAQQLKLLGRIVWISHCV